MPIELNSLEQKVMEAILAGDDPAFKTLAEQFKVAIVSNRKLTGVGFFTRFSVPQGAPRLANRGRFQFGKIAAEIKGVQHGAGFILFVEDGVINFLEGYTYDEPWPNEIVDFRVFVPKITVLDLGSNEAVS